MALSDAGLSEPPGLLRLLFSDKGGGTDLWSLFFTVAIAAVVSALVLSCSQEDADQVTPAITLKREAKNLRHLVLPDAAVIKKLDQEPQTDEAQSGAQLRKRFQRMARRARDVQSYFQRSNIQWDDVELLAEAASGHRPLLVFVNSRSGGGQGVGLLRELKTLLHRLQVVDLKEEGPTQALKWWSTTGQRYRILVCGGDGTVGWILSCLEELHKEGGGGGYTPPVAILPVGTGNDLARVMGWGGGFSGGSIVPILQKVGEAHAAYLDRWTVTCRDQEPDTRPKALPAMPSMGNDRRSVIMCNYLGVGIDAAVALDFHQMRERRPHLFVSRLVNKAWYLKSGTLNPLRLLCRGISSKITLECDGKPIEVPSSVEGVIVLNISSFGGGCDLWGEASELNDEDSDGSDVSPEPVTKDFRPSGPRRTQSLSHARPSMQDQMLEVVGVHGSFYLGAAQVGLYSATRLAQAHKVKITTSDTLPVQVDGEPWLFNKNGEIEVAYEGQALMLARRAASSHAVATDVIDWALEKRHITVEQRNILMREIARRASGGMTGSRSASVPDLRVGA
mmetsp:Transcript_101433/g.293391  ORF Transcript_101433/g.293391 Transcript_101433/m.293391 type:complete len:563 (+) Transcript_101433:64-1752(+)